MLSASSYPLNTPNPCVDPQISCMENAGILPVFLTLFFPGLKGTSLDKIMIKNYNQLLLKWGYELCPGNISTLKSQIELLLGEISRKVSATPRGVDELLSTPTFSVENSVIGIAEMQNGKWYSEPPKSLEDAFTAIHQNLIAIIAGLMKGNQLIDKHLFPSLMQEAFEGMCAAADHPLTQYFPKRFTFQMNALSITGTKISISYKVPLREHSAHLTLTYDASDNTIAFQSSFLQAGELFGEKVSYTTSLFDKFNILPLQTPPIVKSGNVEVIWKLKDKNDIARAFQEYIRFCGLTFSRDGDLSADLLGEIYSTVGFDGCIQILRDPLIPKDQAISLARFLQKKINKQEASGSRQDLMIILLKNGKGSIWINSRSSQSNWLKIIIPIQSSLKTAFKWL